MCRKMKTLLFKMWDYIITPPLKNVVREVSFFTGRGGSRKLGGSGTFS